MKKRFLSILLVMSIVLSFITTIPAAASSSGTCGSNLTWTLDDNGTLTIRGMGDMSDWSSSSAPWYSERSKIKTIVIDDNVTSIGGRAFQSCSNVTSVKMSENITKIGSRAFHNCKNLTDIVIPQTTISISAYAFKGTAIEEIVIPQTVTTMHSNIYVSGSYRFYDGPFADSSLKKITFNTGLSKIPKGACKHSDIEIAMIPDTITAIEEGAFFSCKYLTDVYYAGSEADWKNIIVYSDNKSLESATIHYNCSFDEIEIDIETLTFSKWHAYFLTNTNDATNLATGKSDSNLPNTCWESAENREYLSRTLYNAYKDETVFNIGTVLYGTIDGREIDFGLSEYYDLILSSIVKENYIANFSLEDTKSSISDNFENLAKNLLFELGGAAVDGWYTTGVSIVYPSQLANAFANVFPNMDYGEIVDMCDICLKGAESIGEVIEKAAVVGQLAYQNKATAKVLADIKSATNDSDLKTALLSVIAAYTNYSDPVTIINSIENKNFEITMEATEQIFEIVLDEAVDFVLEELGLGVISPTLSIGTAISNFIFSTGKKCELYFTIKAVNTIEDAIKSVMASYNDVDITKITDIEAEKVLEIYRLLHANALFGLNASKKFVDITYGDKTLAHKIHRSDDTKAMYENYEYQANSQVNNALSSYNDPIAPSKLLFDHLKNGSAIDDESINSIKQNNVEKIVITPPQKLNYTVGEELDTTGMKITAYMTDGTTKNVTDGYLIFGFDSDNIGSKVIILEYENVRASFTIKIEDSDNSTSNSVSYIKVIPNRSPLTYYQHEKFNPEDISVIAYCQDGTSYTVNRYTLMNYRSDIIGERTLTVRHCGKTANFNIEIIEPQLIGLKILEPDKKVYYVNDDINPADIYVIAVYDTGVHALLNTFQYSCSHTTIPNIGINTITISYENQKAEFNVIAYSNETLLGVLDNPIYSNGNEASVSTIYNKDKLYTTIYNASEKDYDLHIIAGFYNSNQLIASSLLKTNITEENQTFEIDIPKGLSTVTEIKLFYWDGNTILPLAKNIDITT